jgi:hypothetical protein
MSLKECIPIIGNVKGPKACLYNRSANTPTLIRNSKPDE